MKKLEPVSLEQKLKIENAKEQLDHLKKIDGDWQNLEFLVDLVVYKKSDGKLKACLIYPGAEQKTMGDYADAYEWCKLSEETQEMVTDFVVEHNLTKLSWNRPKISWIIVSSFILLMKRALSVSMVHTVPT